LYVAKKGMFPIWDFNIAADLFPLLENILSHLYERFEISGPQTGVDSRWLVS
jgi:hypothetical protein